MTFGVMGMRGSDSDQDWWFEPRFQPGRWTHVALCYDGRVVTKEDQARTRGKTGRQRFMSGKMSAYVDGVLQFEQPAVQHHPLKPPPASVQKTFAPEG